MEAIGQDGQHVQQHELQWEIHTLVEQHSLEQYDEEPILYYLIGDIRLQTNISISTGLSQFQHEIPIISGFT